MNILIVLLLWCMLFLMSWPLAILALLLWPIIWLISLPFRLIGLAFVAIFAVVTAIIMLPFKILSWRPRANTHQTS